MTRLMGVLVVAVAVLAILGCKRGSGLDTVRVSGLVTLDGNPVDGAKVIFTPTVGTGRPAAGVTDAKGRFKLTTLNPDDGALVGSYLVGISKTKDVQVESAVKPGMTEEEATEAEMNRYAKSGAAGKEASRKQTVVPDLLPVKYKSPASSGFKADVAKGAKNDFEFPMTSK